MHFSTKDFITYRKETHYLHKIALISSMFSDNHFFHTSVSLSQKNHVDNTDGIRWNSTSTQNRWSIPATHDTRPAHFLTISTTSHYAKIGRYSKIHYSNHHHGHCYFNHMDHIHIHLERVHIQLIANKNVYLTLYNLKVVMRNGTIDILIEVIN